MSDRRSISFAQSEGAEPLPSQLKPREISAQLKARLWEYFYHNILHEHTDYMIGDRVVANPWRQILYDEHVRRRHQMADEFSDDWSDISPFIKNIIQSGDYVQLYDFIEFIARHPNSPYEFAENIKTILDECRSAYRLINGDTICMIGSEIEAQAIQLAFSNLNRSSLEAPEAHLKEASTALTQGRFADSVRESIHAVESVCVILAPGSGEIGPALRALEEGKAIHPAMKKGLSSLYGFTSDERGIRHALLDGVSANVDEADALFMLGACASFITYLIQKGGLIG